MEGQETVNLTLNTLDDPTGQASLAVPTAHTLTISDNDTATLSFAAATSSVGEAAGTKTVGVTLTITGNGVVGTGSLEQPISVNVQDLISGSAAASGVDYTFASPATVTFAVDAASGTQNVTLGIVDDRRWKARRR